MRLKRHFTSDGQEVFLDGLTIAFGIAEGNRTFTVRHHYADHPLGELAVEFLLDAAPELLPQSLDGVAYHLDVLGEYMRASVPRLHDLDPQSYRNLISWLRQARKGDGQRFSLWIQKRVALTAASLYAYGMDRRPGWTRRNKDIMDECRNREMVGYRQEARRRSIEKAMSAAEYDALLKCAVLEMEECQLVLVARNSPPPASVWTPPPERPTAFSGPDRKEQLRAYLQACVDWVKLNRIACDWERFCQLCGCSVDLVHRANGIAAQVTAWVRATTGPLGLARSEPNPYAPFAILAGLRAGIRSEELNVMNVGDVNVERRRAYLHAPDHDDADVMIEPVLLEAYRLVVEWSAYAREKAEDPAPLLLWWLTSGRTAGRPQHRASRIVTSTLNKALLPRFYQKYYARTCGSDGETRPMLHAEGDPSRPFTADFSKFRNAAIQAFLQSEPNLSHVMAFARHRHLSTTGRHYAHVHERDLEDAVARALEPSARLLEVALKGRVVDDATPEVRERDAAGGAVPFGTCGDPALLRTVGLPLLQGGGCTVPRDCLECDALYLHVEKRPVLVADRDQLIAEAIRLEGLGHLREAQNLRSAAILRQAHINRIDHVLGVRK